MTAVSNQDSSFTGTQLSLEVQLNQNSFQFNVVNGIFKESCTVPGTFPTLSEDGKDRCVALFEPILDKLKNKRDGLKNDLAKLETQKAAVENTHFTDLEEQYNAEKTEYDIRMKEIVTKKIPLLKAIRAASTVLATEQPKLTALQTELNALSRQQITIETAQRIAGLAKQLSTQKFNLNKREQEIENLERNLQQYTDEETFLISGIRAIELTLKNHRQDKANKIQNLENQIRIVQAQFSTVTQELDVVFNDIMAIKHAHHSGKVVQRIVYQSKTSIKQLVKNSQKPNYEAQAQASFRTSNDKRSTVVSSLRYQEDEVSRLVPGTPPAGISCLAAEFVY